MEKFSVTKQEEHEVENNLNPLNDSLMSTSMNTVNDNMSIETSNEQTQLNLDNENHNESSQILETSKNLESNNEQTLNSTLINISPKVCIFF